MHSHVAFLLPFLVGRALASPISDVSTPGMSLAKRAADIQLCKDNTCGDCPFYGNTGDGFPNCLVYDTAQFPSDLFTYTETGGKQMFFEFPAADATCKYIVRSPAAVDDVQCGSPSAIALGASCIRADVYDSFMLQFCCGTDDCAAAGTRIAGGSGGSGFAMQLHNSTSGEPFPTVDVRVADVPALQKRDCGFSKSNELHTTVGNSQRVTDDINCGSAESCAITITQEVSESRSISASVSIGDPFGIVSATVGVENTETRSKSWAKDFNFPGGARGYIAFTPYFQCVDGTFTGGCGDDEGVSTSVCWPMKSQEGDGGLAGETKAVLIG